MLQNTLNKKCGIYTTFPKSAGDIEGGLRTKGIIKGDLEEYPLLTYVTVVYNRIDTLQRCMESVWNQNYPNIEYIIIDGNSTDGTKELIIENEEKIDYFISQSDGGIYNAMNKGIMLANGRLICFMNSDDQCTQDAAQKVVDIYKCTYADVICGSRELVENGKIVHEIQYPRFPVKHSVFRYIQMFHQATYAVSEVFDKVGYFDERYALLADWIWESHSIDAGFHIVFSNEKLVRFSYDGTSRQGIYERDKEWVRWGVETFPEIEERDISFFIYCLDRNRHPLFDLEMLNRVAFRYFYVEGFAEAYYETVLLICIEQCAEISAMSKSDDKYIEKKMQQLSFREGNAGNSLSALRSWLECNIMTAYENGIQVREAEKNLADLVKVRRTLNKIFYITYLKGQSKHWGLDRFIRIMCYTLSKLVAQNEFCSRRLYVIMRTIWYYFFKTKFVEN